MNLQLKSLATRVAALVFVSGIFATQALAAIPLARVIVAKSGGNYTTITAALAAIAPTAAAPYVIEVWPGVYTEPGTVNMKSYVHLKGSGRDVTTVKTSLGLTAIVISAIGNTNVTISNLTVTGGYHGILVGSTLTAPSSVTISDNLVTGNHNKGIVSTGENLSTQLSSANITRNRVIGNRVTGIDVTRTSAVVTENTISGNGNTDCVRDPSSCIGLLISGSAPGADLGSEPTHTVTGNVITGNYGSGIYMCKTTRATITNNTVAGNTLGGITFIYQDAGASVTNNLIVNNGSLYADIVATPYPAATEIRNPNISFNIFNTIVGTHGVGSYNVNSNGDPILVP